MNPIAIGSYLAPLFRGYLLRGTGGDGTFVQSSESMPLQFPASKSLAILHTGGDLIAKKRAVQQFAITGNDGKFAWARSESIIVPSSSVLAPAQVRRLAPPSRRAPL